MPTMRLSPNDKSSISHQFTRVLYRAPNSHTFPVPEDELEDWVFSLMPESVSDAYKLVKQYDKKLIQQAGWCFDMKVYKPLTETIAEGEYLLRVDTSKDLPNFSPMIREGCDHYEEILKWSQDVNELNKKTAIAERYVDSAIESCTSAGQIVRVLPEDCFRFVPDFVLNTLADAERRSRIPASFEPDKKKEQFVLDMLAIGSISPETRPGLDVAVIDFTSKT